MRLRSQVQRSAAPDRRGVLKAYVMSLNEQFAR
jgi:hypothetical protein